MVLGRSSHEVAAAATSDVHLTDKPQLRENGQSAVHGDQPDAGMLPTHLLIYGSRGEVVARGGNDIKHRPPLPGEFVTALPQHGLYFLLRSPHPTIK